MQKTIPQQDVAVLALMTGLKEGIAFISYLDRKKLTSLSKVLGKANYFIRGEEFDKEATAKRAEGDGKEKKKDKSWKDKKPDNSDMRMENNSVKRVRKGDLTDITITLL